MSVERIDIAPAEVSAPDGHEAKMIAVVDAAASAGTPENLPAATARPDWLPVEFETVEDFKAAYESLKSGSGKSEDKPEDTPAETPAKSEDEAAKTLESKGLDFNEFSAEFSKNGSLSDESYSKLEAKGIPRKTVDAYIQGQQALAAQYTTQVLEEIGGQDRFAEATKWAAVNLSKDEIDAFNAAVDSGNVAQAKLAVAGLNAKFTAAIGTEPQLISGRRASATEDVFESTAQVTEAMSNPKYKSDPAYRAKVQAKLARSSVF